MENDAPCKIIGIGSIKIKMYDSIVRTLTEVRHVLDFKKNLISLSTLDAKGYRYSGEGGVLKVSKGTLVVLKGQLSHGIYTLKTTPPSIGSYVEKNYLLGVICGDVYTSNPKSNHLWI